MKKVLLVLAIAGALVSCGGKKKSDKPAGADSTANMKPADQGANTTTPGTAATTGVPTFSDPEVQQFANDATALVNSYMDAAKAKDMSKITELSSKWAGWGTKSTEVAQKLANNPEEAKKWADYWTKLAQDWAEAAKALVPAGMPKM